MSGLRTFSSALTLVMLVIFAAMVAIAASYPSGARFMPFVVGIPGIVLCLAQLALDYRRDRVVALREGQPASALRGLPHGPVEPDGGGRAFVQREFLMWGYFLAFIAAILAFGFWVAVPALLATFLRFEARRSWPVALATASGGTVVLWAIFTALLGVRLFAGFLTDDIVRLVGA